MPAASEREWQARFAAALLVLCVLDPLGPAAEPDKGPAWLPPRPGNLLVCVDNTVCEYTADGALVQRLPVPVPQGRPDLRDLVQDAWGRIHVYRAAAPATLCSYDRASGTWGEHSFAGWSTQNNGTYGGLAALGGSLYATSMGEGAGDPRGIVRFRLPDYQGSAFPGGASLTDISAGGDGLLYGLSSGGDGAVRIYDPVTQRLLRTVRLLEPVRAIAADRAGDIFGASWDNGRIYHFARDGSVRASIDGGAGTLADIDLSPSGDLVVCGRRGKLGLTNEGLRAPRTLTVGAGRPFATFVGGSEDQPAGGPLPQSSGPTGRLTVSPEAIEFGSVRLGGAALRDLRVRNTGPAVLRVRVDPPAAPFSLQGEGPFSLQAGETSVFRVGFKPQLPGRIVVALTLASSDPANRRLEVSLAGRGVNPAAP